MLRAFIIGVVLALAAVHGVVAAAEIAIVTKDQTALRAAPRASARQQATLWQGEIVEVRGARQDWLQVYDYRRERGGFVPAGLLHRVRLEAEDAPGLLAVVRLVRDTPGAEALGIAFAAAYAQAATAEVLRGGTGAEVMDGLGGFAERLARRASSPAARTRAAEAALVAHLDVAARYGVEFTSHEREGRMQVCYDGDAFRRLLSLHPTPVQRARAALALTRHECVDPGLGALERYQLDEWRARVLDGVDEAAIPGYLRNRVLMERATLWSGLAFQRARREEDAAAAADRAITALAGIDKGELTEEDWPEFNNTAMRVSASRWAAVPLPDALEEKRPHIITEPGRPGETCVLLVDGKRDAVNPLARRCTYGIAWTGSATLNREGNTLALAVQPMDAWRELWIFHRQRDGWTLRVLPPEATTPGLGYAEFAGWVPGGRQILIVREARDGGNYRRSFEVVQLDTLAVSRQARDAGDLGAFRRWQDPEWKKRSVSLR